MLVVVWRIIVVRVRPHVLLAFERYENDDASSPTSPDGRTSFVSKFQKGWKEDCSLFSWADKGQWEAIQGEHRPVSREDDWFRIGFEPVFVDYTKRGIWFIVISLVEVGLRSFCRMRLCPTISVFGLDI